MKKAAPPSLGRWPFAWPAALGASGLICAESQAWGILVAVVAAAFVAGLYFRKATLVLAAIVALVFACSHNGKVQARDALREELARPFEVTLTGTLTERNSSGLVQRAFSTDSGVRVNLIGLPDHFATGQRLRLVVASQPQLEQRNPGGFDFVKTLTDRGYAGSVQVLTAEQLGWGSGFAILRGWSEDLREILGNKITNGISTVENGQLIRAIALGEKPRNASLMEDFRKTGTMHVFAVSGLHVGLMGLIVGLVAKALRLPPRLTIYLIILMMFGYAFVTGLRPPALRAALMGAIYLSRYLLNRRATVTNNLLAAALIVLACDTFQLWQTGFQLSFFVVAIILFLEPRLWKRVAFLSEQDAFLPKPLWNRWQRWSTQVRTHVLRSFTVSGAAWTGSAPLSLLYFGWFTPIATFASVVMIYGAFLILAIAFLSLAVGLLSPTAAVAVNQGNSLIAGGARSSTTAMSNWPGAWRQLRPHGPWRNGLCVFDIPFGGGAIHLDAGGGVLIDGASTFHYWATIRPALEGAGLSCDSLIGSHTDAQHVGGLRSFLENEPVDQLLVPEGERAGSMANLRESALAAGVPVVEARGGMRLPIDADTSIEVLTGGDPEPSRGDDRGLVLMIHHHGWRILYTADAGYSTEKRLLSAGRNLSADVWICGRNSSDLTGHDHFVTAVAPRVIIATDRRYPAGESLPPIWRKWLESEDILVMSQREHGAVFITPDKDELVLGSYLGRESYRFTR